MLSLEQLRDAAWSALRRLLGDGYEWCIIATFPDSVIVKRDATSLERYPLEVAKSGAVTLGTPDPVELVYAPLRESEGGILGPLPVPDADKLTEAERKAKAGSQWVVTVITEGMSRNRTFYPADVLSAAAPLYEGVPVFWGHTRRGAGGEPDPRDTAGFLSAPSYALLEGKSHRQGAIVATLNATDPGARERLLEAYDAGKPDLFGLSHTAFAEAERMVHSDGKAATKVSAIKAVESVDIVSFPSAGGRVMRLVAGLTSAVPATEEELVMLEKKLARLKEARPDLYAKLGTTPTEAEVDALLLESIQPQKTEPAPAPAALPKPDAPQAGGLSDADRSLLREARVAKIMEGRALPEPLAPVVRDTLLRMDAAGADAASLTAVLESFVAGSAKVVEATKGTGMGVTADVATDEADKVIKALDGFFAEKDVDGVGRFRSIREAYIQITGDRDVTGMVAKGRNLGRFERFTEGLQSGTLSNVLASSLNRALVANYTAQGGAYSDLGDGWLWRAVPINDFRTRERVRFGGYGNLSTVLEGAAYPNLTSPTDEKATYSVSKKGGVETITFEMIRNDDVGAVMEIPRRMAFAARRTLYEFAHNLYATNPTIYDSVALFHANHGSNLGAAALDETAYLAARLAMLKQSEKDSSKRLGLVLSHLMIPPDLEKTAYNLFVRTTNNDANFTQTVRPTIHVITHLTDTNDWFACAGINQVPQIEIGFLDGRQEPEMFVADQPTAGSFFAADKLEWKIRHIYGGAVLDYRGFYGAYGI